MSLNQGLWNAPLANALFSGYKEALQKLTLEIIYLFKLLYTTYYQGPQSIEYIKKL